MIVALSFVPIEGIDIAFEALENEIGRKNRNRTQRSAFFFSSYVACIRENREWRGSHQQLR
ncbi:hypothetical protein HZS_7225 [Henneguya salminicola]|nr:hypothetical protein HZS_7225 [Henneguya salminicola]